MGRRPGVSPATLKVWDLTSRQPVTTLQVHADWVLACAVTPDGRCVVSASEDNTLKFWDLAAWLARRDEYDPPAGTPSRDPLAAFLPRALPRGVSQVCASRPRHPYVDMLATRDC